MISLTISILFKLQSHDENILSSFCQWSFVEKYSFSIRKWCNILAAVVQQKQQYKGKSDCNTD